MDNKQTLKEIAFELLDLYKESEETVIWEYGTDIAKEMEELREKVTQYKEKIENAKS